MLAGGIGASQLSTDCVGGHYEEKKIIVKVDAPKLHESLED